MWKMVRTAILPIILLMAMTCGLLPQAVAGMEQATFVVA